MIYEANTVDNLIKTPVVVTAKLLILPLKNSN